MSKLIPTSKIILNYPGNFIGFFIIGSVYAKMKEMKIPETVNSDFLLKHPKESKVKKYRLCKFNLMEKICLKIILFNWKNLKIILIIHSV